MIETVLLINQVFIIAQETGCLLDTGQIIGQHIGHKNLRIAVIVEVSHISPHTEMRTKTHPLRQRLPEGTVLLVDIEIIPLIEIIGDIDIHPAIEVDIPDRYAQTKANNTAVDTCFFTYIDKAPLAIDRWSVIAIKLIPPELIAERPEIAKTES